MNRNGQLGTGDTTLVRCPIPVKFSVPSSSNIKKISCGANHTIILTTDNKLYAFGENAYVCYIVFFLLVLLPQSFIGSIWKLEK